MMAKRSATKQDARSRFRLAPARPTALSPSSQDLTEMDKRLIYILKKLEQRNDAPSEAP